jgi:hypothetical protein
MFMNWYVLRWSVRISNHIIHSVYIMYATCSGWFGVAARSEATANHEVQASSWSKTMDRCHIGIYLVFYVNCWINCWIYGIYRISIMLVAGNFCCKETAHFAKVWASQVKLQTQKEILQTPAFLESGRIRMASQNWWAETWPGLVVIPVELSTLGLAFASLRSS